jgi:transposase
MPKAATPISLTKTQRAELQKLERAAHTPQHAVLRARIVLRADAGEDNTTIAAALHIGANTVAKWRGRFASAGLAGLGDAARSGRPARLREAAVQQVLTEVTRPPKGRTRWSVRSMARHAGISKSSVHQLWMRNDLKPHRTRTFKISNDPLFEAKFWDIIGLYLEPPHKALVLCCDEKSQCQALERTQPGLPLGIGRIRTRTHDYTRHGTVTLFAAPNYLEGKILHQSAPRHRHQEWLEFLRHLDAETPPDLDLHLVLTTTPRTNTPRCNAG